MESTLIYRLSDGKYLLSPKKCKLIILKLNPQTSEPRASIDSGSHTLHYLIVDTIIYVCITTSNFPKKLVFSYLAEISTEFSHVYASELSRPDLKPYQFIQFDSFISKTKKIYGDSRAQSNLDQLNTELVDVKKIMNKNIEDLLYRGDSLDKLQDLSANLKNQSQKYKKYAEKINFQLLLKQYAPVVLISLFILFIIYRVIF
ncbi:hypothetical protein KL930_002302 [Ogataea haglerorum]|uniref:Protein transport protein SEC22 n=1 Tax=Ogataea haglerorum TaxID=1937702 RepID=A0AAN6D776_9ASCO|nr:uncharacterized protein KL911_000092 [Ogataea haglerorum]KAG7698910.1 hypothetical protein KL915_001202 [Ogataea haglerorum]KAG7700514.1 hypothetical protein KL951_000629 [Ogataea haglerorum]KAG7709952.1 hypothetical protein KL914_000862 [Ogataea haglerorum]KAG7711267.1 hypothetical protein KL950_001233 [Ogataea haglerorum]KAG7720564.1 hypothetical protein KL913_001464 [Ogataea haglerorum]